MKVVISMGGSILASPSPNVGLIKDFAKLLISLKDEGHDIKVVVGGGELARKYITPAKELGADWKSSDMIGIAATRMNAMLLLVALGEHALEGVPTDTEIDCESREILVMGGIKPGQTTDAVAADLAVRCRADLFLIGTNVDGVYDGDPKKDPGAKKISEMNSSELLEIVGVAHSPGMKTVVDPVAALKIHEHGIRTAVVDGRSLENLKNAINGRRHGGTDIIFA